MATVEQLRERQDEIVTHFHSQRIPVYRGQLTETARRAVVNAIQEPRGAKGKRGKKTLPLPSREVRDFLMRALNNGSFRGLMERLANE